MSEQTTLRCGLPLLQPAQAQKHVTVNDALMRLDGLVNLVLESTVTPTPPASVVDGMCYGVPAGGTGAWSGFAGQIAIAANGGWVFVQPQRGQRAFVRDLGAVALWSGSVWEAGALTLGAFGSGMNAGVMEAEVAIAAGAAFNSGVIIPANKLLIGVTARVVEAITGAATSWTMGTTASPAQFGSGLGIERNSWSQGLLSAPMGVYTPVNIRISPTGGNFAGGRVRLSVHWLELRLPDSVA